MTSQSREVQKRVPLDFLIKDARPGFASGERDENGIIQVRMNNVTTEGKLNFNETTRVPDKQKKIEDYHLVEGDVLFNCTNSPKLVGKTAVFGGYPEPVVFSNHFIRLRVDENELDARYLTRWLTLQWKHRVFEGMCTQWVNQASVRKERLLALKIPLPPLPEQRRIAAILDKADALREKRRQALTKLDTLLKSVFIEMFGDPVTNPKGWDKRPFESFLETPLRNGLSPSSQGNLNYRVLTLSAITRGAFDEMAVKEGPFEEAPSEKFVNKEDFLICRGNGNKALVGTGRFPVRDMPDTFFPDTMIAARINREIIDPFYLEMIWDSRLVREQIESSARTTNGTYKINQRVLESIKINYPHKDLQQKFSNFASQIHNLKSNYGSSLKKLETLFQSLQQRAFSGELAADTVVSAPAPIEESARV